MERQEFIDKTYIPPNGRCYISYDENRNTNLLLSEYCIDIPKDARVRREKLFKSDEFEEWCCENLHHKWTGIFRQSSNTMEFYFEDRHETVLFKLTWT